MLLLSDIEVKILVAIYQMRTNAGKKIELNDFDLEESSLSDRTNEFVFYCKNLERLELIILPRSFTSEGGRAHPKYNNRAIIVWPEEIDITKKGIDYVEKNISA